MTPTDRDQPAARPWPTITMVVVATALAALLAGCAATMEDDAAAPAGTAPTHDSLDEAGHGGATPSPHGADHGEPVPAEEAPRVPLRDGDRRLTVTMPEAYHPTAPTESGADDYRCFLVDPELEDDVFVTGTDVSPGDPSMVHHVILYQVPPEQVDAARTMDGSMPGQGWTCFGGSGLDTGGGPQAAPWLGAWTPGSSEAVLRDGYGIPLAAGSQLVMQVHYSLLTGDGPDITATELRVTDGSADLAPVSTVLLPAPVELPCRPEYSDGPLCSREAALADLRERFGDGPGSMAEWLRWRCPGGAAGPEQSCTTTFSAPGTIIGVAGHMHLLGRAVRVEVNPGTSSARTLLDVPVWNFDDQGAVPIEPVEIAAGDRITVTCEHDQSLRDHIPAFEGQPDRYVLWGEGSTDEMCAGILQIAQAGRS